MLKLQSILISNQYFSDYIIKNKLIYRLLIKMIKG
jgi:hypothetical protein